MAFLPESYRGEKFIGISELAKAVETLLKASGAKQERGTVSEIPDERTIRYYQSEGLIDPPISKSGPASVFTFKHLLQLVAIKLLQAQDVPIKKLRFVLEGKSEYELQQLIERSKQSLSNDATTFLLSLRSQDTSAERTETPLRNIASSEGPSMMRSMSHSKKRLGVFSLLRMEESDDSDFVASSRSASAQERKPAPKKHKIRPGIELRTSEEEIIKLSKSEFDEILLKITKILSRFLERDP